MASRSNALEFKGRSLPITRLRVLDSTPAAIERSVADFARKMPQAVKGLAVILDSDIDADLDALLECLRGVGMQVLAVSEGPLAASARARQLAVVSREGFGAKELATREPAREAVPPPAPAPEPARAPVSAAEPASAQSASPARRAARIVVEPVRSGQQIYAEYSDLIVLNTVSTGAEVIADGCVHVYGTLRGRALAGARGDENARIFCRKLEAELIAVAGIYAVADQIKSGPQGTAAQAYLENGKLKIEPHIV